MNTGGTAAAWVTLIGTVFGGVGAFRAANRTMPLRRAAGPLRSDHIDEMMFECGIYNENLRFPRNVEAVLNPHASKDAGAQARMEQMSLELTTKQLEIFKKRKEHMRIQLPISGEVSKPEGGYLQEIYYILEEHNRQMVKNQLAKPRDVERAAADGDVDACADAEMDIEGQRKLVLPTQMWRIFDSPEVTQTYYLFPTAIKSQSPLVPGQVSTITLMGPHKKMLIEQISNSNVFGLGVAFVEPPAQPGQDPELSPHASLCEFVDISDLDTTGMVVVRAVQRLQIKKIKDQKEAVLVAEVRLLNDDRGRMRNPVLSTENSRAVAKLYDKCNAQEAHLGRITGRHGDVEVIEAREPFNEKLERMIRDVPVNQHHELAIMELTSFAALEFHADAETRLWAANIRDTEERLACAKVTLEEKSAYLRERIAQVKGRAEPLRAPQITQEDV